MGSLIFLLVLGLVVGLAIHRNIVVRRTYIVVVRLPREETLSLVRSMFTRTVWTNARGPGEIAKGRVSSSRRMLVVSVDVVDRGDGTSEVHAWVSNCHGILGSRMTIANGALKPLEISNRLRRNPAFVEARLLTR